MIYILGQRICSFLDFATSENQGGQSVLNRQQLEAEEKDSWDDCEIPDIGTLIRGLKEVPVDSERIILIRRFLEQGGEDLYYLADEVCHSYINHTANLTLHRCQK